MQLAYGPLRVRDRYTLDGFHIISIDENGVKSMRVDRGEEEEVCAALS